MEAAKDKVLGMRFSGEGYFDPHANNGLGEYKAYMVLVREHHEGEAEDNMRAFASAGVKNGVRVRDGVVALSRKQIEMRIESLKKARDEARSA